jgi:hypothetical protein
MMEEFHPQLHSQQMRESQKLAFENILSNGLLSLRRLQAYGGIYEMQYTGRVGVTSGELDRHCSKTIQGWSRSFSPRLIELVRLGVIYELPELVKCTVTDQSVTGYMTTDSLPNNSKLKGLTKPKPHKNTITRGVLEMRSCYDYWTKCGGTKLTAFEQIISWLDG